MNDRNQALTAASKFHHRFARWLWKLLAASAFLLGLIGMIVPGLPTVPFWIASAWAAGKGWPQLENWLLQHPRFGPGIRAWREQGVVPRRAKWMATVMMAFSAIVMQFTTAPMWVRYSVPALMVGVLIWLWRRPEK